jgi:hypothetical protein
MRKGDSVLFIPAPVYSLAIAAWIPRITIWRDDGTTHRRDGEPCESWAEAMRASWRGN